MLWVAQVAVCSEINTSTKHGFNHLNTKRRPLYLKTQSVPRCKHFSLTLKDEAQTALKTQSVPRCKHFSSRL